VASNRRSSVAAVAMAPAFVVVAVVVGAATTPSATGPVGRAADGSSVAARGIPAAPALAPAGQLGDGAVAPPPAVRRVAPPTSIGSVAPRGPAKPQVARITGRAAAAPTAAPRTQATPPALKPAPAKPAAPSGGGCDEGTHYVNVSGNCVLRPVEAAVAPAGASARCKDGTYSSSQHRSGTCSGHKGVAEWLKDLP